MHILSYRPNSKNLVAIVLIALAVTVGMWTIFGFIHRALEPYTILDLEFAWAPARLGEMAAHWGEAGNAAARLSLWVDFAFMPAYALLFSGVTLLAARALPGRWQTAGLWLGLAPFAAWAFDALENVMLLNALPPAAPSEAGLMVAGAAAAVKFALLVAGALYSLGALIWHLLRKR